MTCYSPLKGWKDDWTGGITFRRDGTKEAMEVACGQCIGCRLDRSRMWATRIVHESSLHEYTGGNCFVTLTYRDERHCDEEQLRNGYHVPWDWSLDKRHFTKFMKRLRKHFAPQKIRYYQCGEYGRKCRHGFDLSLVKCPSCRLGRPHHHAILFNCSFSDLVSYRSDNGVLRYTSPTLERIWKYGFVDVGEVTFESAAYVARYILKKITGHKAEDHYITVLPDGTMMLLEPEYVTMSRGGICEVCRRRDCKNAPGGIGKKWFDKFGDDVFPADIVPVPGKGVFRKVPRYYEELFRIASPLTLEEIKRVRRKFKEEHIEEYSAERLETKFKVKKKQIELLKRTLG